MTTTKTATQDPRSIIPTSLDYSVSINGDTLSQHRCFADARDAARSAPTDVGDEVTIWMRAKALESHIMGIGKF